MLNWNDLECSEWPHCIDYLKQTQRRLVESLQNLTDEQLDDMVPMNWGDLWPIKQIISIMTHHDTNHLG
ncbi:MAG: DinB family protein [Candidatus Hodarchaeota archaeon]